MTHDAQRALIFVVHNVEHLLHHAVSLLLGGGPVAGVVLVKSQRLKPLAHSRAIKLDPDVLPRKRPVRLVGVHLLGKDHEALTRSQLDATDLCVSPRVVEPPLAQDNVVKEVVTAPGRAKRISWPTDLTPILVGCDANEPTTLEHRRDEIGHLAPMRWIEHLSIFI